VNNAVHSGHDRCDRGAITPVDVCGADVNVGLSEPACVVTGVDECPRLRSLRHEPRRHVAAQETRGSRYKDRHLFPIWVMVRVRIAASSGGRVQIG
jgi:hypothetical protein